MKHDTKMIKNFFDTTIEGVRKELRKMERETNGTEREIDRLMKIYRNPNRRMLKTDIKMKVHALIREWKEQLAEHEKKTNAAMFILEGIQPLAEEYNQNIKKR